MDWLISLADKDWQALLVQTVGYSVSGCLRFYIYFGWVLTILWLGGFLIWVTSCVGRILPFWMGERWFRWGVLMLPGVVWPLIAHYNFPDKDLLFQGIQAWVGYTLLGSLILSGTVSDGEDGEDDESERMGFEAGLFDWKVLLGCLWAPLLTAYIYVQVSFF